MNIKSAKYKSDEGINVSITAVIDEITWSVPLDSANRHYIAILEWAKEDGNEIQEAE
mgnify:FL=1|tara:strand:+ start:381 stop:551 length:171 start_codon:yes stop_codon:yes gene_type:complete